jgi:cell division protein FtsZ
VIAAGFDTGQPTSRQSPQQQEERRPVASDRVVTAEPEAHAVSARPSSGAAQPAVGSSTFSAETAHPTGYSAPAAEEGGHADPREETRPSRGRHDEALVDAVRVDDTPRRTEPARPDTARPDPGRPDPGRPEPGRTEGTRPEAAGSDQADQGGEEPRSSTARPEGTRAPGSLRLPETPPRPQRRVVFDDGDDDLEVPEFLKNS